LGKESKHIKKEEEGELDVKREGGRVKIEK